MVAAAGAMAMSNPLLLNPLILSQVINAQQLNQNDPKFHFSQVKTSVNDPQFDLNISIKMILNFISVR
jgi:hypothetical protein